MVKRKEKILIIDDDPSVLVATRMVLKKYFQNIYISGDPNNVIKGIFPGQYDILLLDMNFSPGNKSGKEGLGWIKKFREKDPRISIISITAYGDISLAVEAMKSGAVDFIAKPWENERLITSVMNISELKSAKNKLNMLSEREKRISAKDENKHQIIGDSQGIMEVHKVIEKVAPTEANILITGENGTGKELFAREIHRLSTRNEEVFLSVDLGSITQSLFESELFGHVKGSFTDAKTDRMGWIEMAEGGTLFLDEISNIPPHIQQKLLTVLQSRTYIPVGGQQIKNTDIRLVTATNANLEMEISKGLFRKDLFYRINTVEIRIPALRERKIDIPVIADHYLRIFSKRYQKKLYEIRPDGHRKLMEYTWPGNIRELMHVIERAVILSENESLGSADFLFRQTVTPVMDILDINILERQAIQNAITINKNNYSKAAGELGISRSTLYRKIEKYGL